MESIFKVNIKEILKKEKKEPEEASHSNPTKISILDCSQQQEESKPRNPVQDKDEFNIVIIARNIETLDEYHIATHVDKEFVLQLKKWIKKQKYTIKSVNEADGKPLELLLEVEIFKFNLKKAKKRAMRSCYMKS